MPPMRLPRFQFSLRTLLIVVTLICLALGGYVGWQKKIVLDREEVLAWIGKHWSYSLYHDKESSLPWHRRMMGDRGLKLVLAENSMAEERDRIQSAFPEAKIVW